MRDRQERPDLFHTEPDRPAGAIRRAAVLFTIRFSRMQCAVVLDKSHGLAIPSNIGYCPGMISIYRVKPAFQALLRPAVARLAGRGVTANQVTCAALFLSVLLGGGLYLCPLPILFLLLPVWLPLRMALNAMDGMLAREYGQKTVLGCYLNELADIVSDAALYLPFVRLPEFGAPAVLLFIFLGALSETAGILGPLAGASRRYDGPLGKSDRAAAVGILGLMTACFPMPAVFVWAFPLLDLLLCLTIVNRVRQGIAEARG